MNITEILMILASKGYPAKEHDVVKNGVSCKGIMLKTSRFRQNLPMNRFSVRFFASSFFARFAFFIRASCMIRRSCSCKITIANNPCIFQGADQAM